MTAAGPTVVVGTAGHIDHGKTSLLRALTGIDADRLPEERARGMTIDVGYAHLAFDDGVELDFVDVPGHDRLIGNMLVGAGEIDAAMLVVAADDGPRPQTIEHLQLLDALGIDAGVAVVTKVDAVPPDRVDEVVAEVAALLAPTTLAGSQVLPASSVTGDGIDEVRIALRLVRDRVATRPVAGPLRLAIDRVFTPKGRGVVVTGTLRGGLLANRASLRREPGSELVRVRELQVHGEPREHHGGGRTALNLGGSLARPVRRGDVLTSSASTVRSTTRLLVALRWPMSDAGRSPWPPRARAGLRLHVGTDQADAAMRSVRDADGFAVLTLGSPIATFPGDRAVLRDAAQHLLVGSVRVVDLEPPRGVSARRLTPQRLGALLQAIQRRDEQLELAARTDIHGVEPVDPTIDPKPAYRRLALAADVRSEIAAAALRLVSEHHAAVPLSTGMPLPRLRSALLRHLRSLATVARGHVELARTAIDEVITSLVDAGAMTRNGDAVRDPDAAAEGSADLLAAMERLFAALDVAAPPPLDEAAAAVGCPPDGVRALAAAGRIVRLGPDLAWATPMYHRLAADALRLARAGPLAPAAFRDATGTSRKFVLAILEDLDRREILRRTPDGHVPGPRAPGATRT